MLMYFEKEIPTEKLKNSEVIGISSGASAPEQLVQNLLNEIYTNCNLNKKLINSISANFFLEEQILGEHFMIFNFVISLYLISIQGLLTINSSSLNNNNNNNFSNRNSFSSFHKNNFNKNDIKNVGVKSDERIPDYEIDKYKDEIAEAKSIILEQQKEIEILQEKMEKSFTKSLDRSFEVSPIKI